MIQAVVNKACDGACFHCKIVQDFQVADVTMRGGKKTYTSGCVGQHYSSSSSP